MDVEPLIAEIARTTGLRLDKADPIFAAAILNEIVLDKTLAKFDRQVRLQADRVTAASTQAVADARQTAELLLSEAGEWAEARIKAAGESAAAALLAEIRQEKAKVVRLSRTAVVAAWVTGIFVLVGLCGAGGIVLAGLLHR